MYFLLNIREWFISAAGMGNESSENFSKQVIRVPVLHCKSITMVLFLLIEAKISDLG